LADSYCFQDRLEIVGINDFSGWASTSPAYSVRNGTAAQPITIKNYQNEEVVFDVRGFTQSNVAVRVRHKSYWVFDGIEIIGGMVNISGGTRDVQTHDITIQNCEVHDVTLDGGDNPGLIRIDRGDYGGPYNINVLDNTLHSFYDHEYPGQWDNVPDAQHFGAVTTLSAQVYLGYDHGGTGRIVIRGNHIYHTPQAFFFKNAMQGPIIIENNRIHEVGSLGILSSANVTFSRNLVYDVDPGFTRVGGSPNSDPRIEAISGQTCTVTYNTFVGLHSLMSCRAGTGHTIDHNIFFGMNGRTPGAGWDTPSYIAKSEVYPDVADPANSRLQQITANNNCFVTPYSDFQAVSRYLPPESTGSDWLVEHYNLEQARQTFGFDRNSTVVIASDRNSFFANPSRYNYQLNNPNQCPGMGYYEHPDTKHPKAPGNLRIVSRP
jgi:hypothetical protein